MKRLETWHQELTRLARRCLSRRRKVHFIRYADDFIVTGDSKELLENKVKPVIIRFLKERGLTLAEEKTKVTHIREGFDFLGQNVRKYNENLLVKPSKKNVKSLLEKSALTQHPGTLLPGNSIMSLFLTSLTLSRPPLYLQITP